MLFGAHVSTAGGISTAIDRIEAAGGDAVQVFTQSPRQWAPTKHPEEELERFRERRRAARVRFVSCHAVYLTNLASRDRTVRRKSLRSLVATMETARALGADAAVLHVGSHLGYGFKAALRAVVPALRKLVELTTDDLWLCLENTAGAGGTIGRSVSELAELCERLDGHPRLGICIDSCHWWASGVDVSDPRALDAAVHELDDTMGLDRLRLLHVNDSKTPLGSNVDRHDYVGQGLIGEGLATFLGHPAFADLPAIVETWVDRGPETEDLDRMRELRRKGARRWSRAKARALGPDGLSPRR